ncbi:cell division protein FtsL [Oceanobacillus limi]|uniref:Cell division protein FtsL n=1 Tax=Oceanobacillus limi TaxID=930131 RepID=A0A1I0DDP4_9BACI|nr:cell division protein FtsL [Oceanobacillus limi]SET30243.1 cell division protein FtsL [Oceanobacillus limi]
MAANHARTWQTYTSQPTHQTTPEKKKVVVRKHSWITKGEKVLYSFVGALLLVAGVYIVSFSSSTDSLNRDLQSLEQTVQTQEVTNEALMFEIKELSRPERITQRAKESGLTIQNAKVKQASSVNN